MQKENLNIFAAVCVLMIALTGSAAGKTTYVDPNGSADFTSIQAAINDANDDDKIEVAPGTYNEAINFNGKAVRLYSSGGRDVTTIDANGLNSSVVTCNSGEEPNTIIEGFTITGGNATDGGGMYNSNSSPTVTNCTFTGNTATNNGGGMYCENSSPTVINCIFSGNETINEDGGGIFNYNSDPNLTNCAFFENNAADVGGAMLMSNSSPTVTNCTFYGNSARYAGAMRIYQSSPILTNCILWGNTASISGAEIYAPGETFTVTYSDIQGWTSGGTGNINSDPCFVDSAGGDFRLLSDSPCVDKGDNNSLPQDVTDFDGDGDTDEPIPFDLDLNPRVWNDIVDMGAFEYGELRVHNVTQNTSYIGIQRAVNDANDGDEIEVAPGTYKEQTIDFKGKAVRLYSTDGPNDTIIDGSGNYHVVQCISGEGPNTILEGFTITGGNANGTDTDSKKVGGGMYNYASSPTVADCNFTGNQAGWGGGMYNTNASDPNVTNCTFSGNAAINGGGMYNLSNSSPTVTSCTFMGNTASSATDGGGGMLNLNSSPTVTDCNFSDNTASHGGGMYNYFSFPTLTNCTFSENMATKGGGMFNLGWQYGICRPAVYHCTFSDNSASEGGGGMCNDQYAAPVVGYCTFSDNEAGTDGGGIMNNLGEQPTIYHCTFNNNTAASNGGGIANNWSSPLVSKCTFNGNSAEYGGGMWSKFCYFVWPNPCILSTVTNCKFTGNYAGTDGGGMLIDSSDPTVTNCTFSSNTSIHNGGGIYITGGSPKVTNCTFHDNSADTNGGGLYNGGSPTVTNCIFWGDKPDEIFGGGATVTYSDVQSGYGGEGNINKYPMFVDAGAGDFRLSWYSPCVDAGENNASGLPATDLDGNPRIIDGDGDGDSVVDMGAYELEAGMFKVGIGTLAVTIEPNEAVDAGAKWRVEGGEQWYNSGDVITLPPGYYKVEVNELPAWYEPETLLVGYDTVDSNKVPQQSPWVRVIGDMNAVVTAEYRPLPVFAIGEIPPRDAPHGRRLEFFVDANWLGDDVLYSFTTTFDPNYPEPEGPISFDVNSGLFTYEPNDAYDRTAFTVTFRAESVADVNEQAVKVKPMRDLPLEYEILSAPVQEIPDPCDYIFVNDVNSDSEKELNGELKYVRSVTIAGEQILIEDIPGNPVYVFANNRDVNDLTICADKVVIRDKLHLPQTRVAIYAGQLCFEGAADINTTPVDFRAIPPDQNTDGLSAGNISLYIESYEADGGLNGRLILNGTKGYYGGSPGEDGVLTCTLDNQQPFTWLSPYSLKMVIARARDTYLYRYTAETHDMLSEYSALLNTYRALPEWDELEEQWQFEFEQMHQEIITLLHRIDNGLDYFGNPPDWVPALSFEVLYTVYEQEIDHAIRVMYLSYWLQNKADDITKKEAALSNCRSQLWDDTVQARGDYNIVKDLIGPLKAEADSITSRIGRADDVGCYGLLCKLKEKEAELLRRAKRKVQEAHKVPWWKTAGRIISVAGISTVQGASAGSRAGPKGAAAGGIAGAVVGSIGAFTDDSIMNPNPWPQASMRTDVVKQFNSIDFENATEGWLDDFNDIENLSDIETHGINTYMQNLRGNAADMADGLVVVKDALKTTMLDNSEVEAKLKEIKATDPTFNSLVDDVTELMVDKQIFNRKLAAAMQKVATLSNSMTNNVLAIDAMNRDKSRLNRIVDPKALMYLRDMESRALARLRKYHYYMAKAYEYRLLEPYPGDLNIDVMFNKIKEIAATPLDPETKDGYLGPQDFDALKVVYEDELKQLTEHILTLFLSGRIEKSVKTWIEIYDEEELRQINSGEPLTVNLFEEGLFPSNRENIRIVDMRVEEPNMIVTLTGDCNGFGQITVKMQHPAVSKLQYFQQLEPGTENIYQFRHLAEDTKDLLDINWESEYNIVNGTISHPQLSASQQSLLWTLLGEDDKEHALIYSRPGAWADIKITKRDNLPRPKPGCTPCQGYIEYMNVTVWYDYYDKKNELQTLHVTTYPIVPPGLSTYELMPYFLVDTPDECGRKDGVGNFYRVYEWATVPQVSITAPETYGNWRFDKWTYLSGEYWVNEYGLMLEFEFSTSPDNPTVWADYVYEGPILSIADFDEDYDVDFEDYAALSRVWLTEPSDPEWDAIYDISDPPDNYIDWRDVAILCGNWLADTGSEL